MLLLRQLAPFLRLSLTRFYARKTVTTIDGDMKQVHQETLRFINPHATIKVDSDINVKVSSIDPHKYPNGDAFIAELHGGPVKNCTASMEVKISDDEKFVEVFLKKLTDSTDFHCDLAVPIKASLNITTRCVAIIKNTFGDELKVKADKLIKTNNVRAERIELQSYDGNIHCQGILLGKETIVETKNKGNIILDKLQGDNITCKTSEGNITTNCSYVESSKFETETGCLDLKNVHKNAKIHVREKGDLKMTGVHGNLSIFINEGTMNLQLSELQGENVINASNLSSSVINISNKIEENTLLEISLGGATSKIILDKTLEHLSLALDKNQQHFKWPFDKNYSNKLTITSKSSLALGKSSWTDMIRLQMAEQQNDKS